MDNEQRFALEYLIELNGMTRSYLAKKLGVVRSNITRWINEQKVPQRQITELSRVFNVEKHIINKMLTEDEQRQIAIQKKVNEIEYVDINDKIQDENGEEQEVNLSIPDSNQIYEIKLAEYEYERDKIFKKLREVADMYENYYSNGLYIDYGTGQKVVDFLNLTSLILESKKINIDKAIKIQEMIIESFDIKKPTYAFGYWSDEEKQLIRELKKYKRLQSKYK